LIAGSYGVLMSYDALALRHIRKTLPFRRIALASFTSYAFTHSFGFGSLMHATIRYRLYAPLGTSTAAGGVSVRRLSSRFRSVPASVIGAAET
jgi:phosphatidylglycerol lysyltransferase